MLIGPEFNLRLQSSMEEARFCSVSVSNNNQSTCWRLVEAVGAWIQIGEHGRQLGQRWAMQTHGKGRGAKAGAWTARIIGLEAKALRHLCRNSLAPASRAWAW